MDLLNTTNRAEIHFYLSSHSFEFNAKSQHNISKIMLATCRPKTTGTWDVNTIIVKTLK